MQNIVKNTDCTNHIKELWKVFTKEGKELFSYTIRGEGEDEEEFELFECYCWIASFIWM